MKLFLFFMPIYLLPYIAYSTLEVRYNVGYGQAVYISGEGKELGDWKRAFRLENHSSNLWKLANDRLRVGAGFKLLLAPWDKGEEISTAEGRWEQGGNHIVTNGDMILVPNFFTAGLPPWSPDSDAVIKNVVKSSKIIKLNIEPPYYNASIVVEDNGLGANSNFIMVFRYDRNERSEARTAHMAAVRLDASLKPVGPIFDLRDGSKDPKPPSQTEDPRIFKMKDHYYVIFNDSETYKYNGRRNTFVAQLTVSPNKISMEKAIKLTYPQRDFHALMDKNWTPFVSNDELYLIFSFNPFVVLKADLASGHCYEVTKTLKHRPWEANFGEMRGGTQAIPVDGEYLTFFHSSGYFPDPKDKTIKRRYYVMGALTFIRDPLSGAFKVTKMTEVPIVGDGFYGPKNPSGIVFVMGLVVHNNDIIISYGIGDEEIGISVLDKAELLKSMKEVN